MTHASSAIHFVSDVHLVTVDEARVRLGGICRNTLSNLEKTGELTPWRIDKRVFYRSVDIERYLLKRDVPSNTEGLPSHLQFLVSTSGIVYGLTVRDCKGAAGRAATSKALEKNGVEGICFGFD
jgi:hypothetical protein